jgi:hypothetical protein
VHYLELNIVNGAIICLPAGSFVFWPHGEGGTIVRFLDGSAAPIHVDESYEYIVKTLATCANAYVYRSPSSD